MNNNTTKIIMPLESKEISNDTKPLIFTKKVNYKHKIIPLSITKNTLGPNRHFPAATKEWLNSIYTYNNNSMKTLPVDDKNLTSLIKSYFNLYFSKRIIKSKRIAMRFRRINLNKIFVGKPELKHTNSKVIITLFVYNEEKRVLDKEIKEFSEINFPLRPVSKSSTGLDTSLTWVQKKPMIKAIKENMSTLDYLNSLYKSLTTNLEIEEAKLLNINKNYESINKSLAANLGVEEAKKLTIKKKHENNIKRKLLLIEEIKSALGKLSDTIDACNNDETYLNICESYYYNSLDEYFWGKDITKINKLKMLLELNRLKFSYNYLLKLKDLVQKIYNKEVEFNIVNLKNLYLDTNIFTEAIAIKLKNRDNKLTRVLRTCVSMVKFPRVNRVRDKYGVPVTNQIWANKIKNMYVNSKFDGYKSNNDILNELLLDIMPNFTNSNTTPLLSGVNNDNKFNKSITIQGLVLNSLKDKNMAGVRLEARGRLTKRFTASRSVFKVKWKGGLKTINSSFKGLSSVILRGHVKPNVQYSFTNNKTRNGAFGLKGWISSK